MADIEIRLPKMGESVTEATITNWLKNIGDQVNMDEPLVEVATDKVDNELPSEASGILIKRLFEKDQVAQVGDVIAVISTNGEASSPTADMSNQGIEATPKNEMLVPPLAAEIISKEKESITTSEKFYSPLVKSMASKEGISLSELDALQGTGKDGRVTKNDVVTYLESRTNKTATPPSKETTTQFVTASNIQSTANVPASSGFLANIKEPIVVPNPGDEIIEMDRMRKLIAEHMVMSTHISPHVTSYVEADVTNIVNWRNKTKDVYKRREGQNLTFTPIFIEAIVKAIKDFPMINVSVSGSTIIKRKDINIGMATALPSGNLIVPVIKNADQLNLVGLTKQVNSLANNARDNKLKPEDIQGGTYTVTNVGTFGNVMGTPIINQPQVAILALGAIRKVPAVIETPEGDFIGIRHKMFLSHSYDHRVVDGALGGQFVRRVADYLEQFDINKEI
jgi:2-oxoglutarate dehydrogenase E2 component (dihydrolipoamide succinyltransferase)